MAGLLDDTEETYPSIRAAIDVALDAADLPDAIISLAIFAPAADREVRRRVPDWASRDADSKARLTLGAIYLTAAWIVPALPNLVRESVGGGDFSYQVENMRPADKVRLLLNRAATEIAAVKGVDATATFFTLARAGSGGVSEYASIPRPWRF